MINIMPMAGLGSRFSNTARILPKPLIPVSGKPMVLNAVDDMPTAQEWHFIVRKEHVDKYSIDRLIKSKIHDANIIAVDYETAGQAATCMIAVQDLSDDDAIFIGACDNGFLYDSRKFEETMADPKVDAMAWTFTGDRLLSDNPTAWGWVRTSKNGTEIEDVSVKIPISENPEMDHAMVGAFYFKRAGDFKNAYRLMTEKDFRTNGEFYVDSIPVFMRQLGKKSVIFDVDLYVGWGKPSDLYRYEEREYLYGQDPGSLERHWRQYFDQKNGSNSK